MTAHRPGALDPCEVRRYFETFHRLSVVEPPRPLPSGPETAVWRLAAPSRAYVAKIFPADRFEAVRTEVDLFDYLRDGAVRTPDPLANKRGERVGRLGAGWRSLLGARKYPVIVMPFEDGRRVRADAVTRDELLLIARHIGLMHKALQQYPRREEIRRTERWASRFGRFDDFLASANARSFACREFPTLRELDRRMEQRAAEAAASRAPAQSVLHGDLGLHHVRLPGRTSVPADVPFLFDFSDFSYGPVVADLATLLSQLYRESADVGRWEQLRTWLLEGYTSAFVLGPGDRQAVEGALIERLLIEVRYLTRVSLTEGRAVDPEGIRKRYRLAEHLLGGRRAAAPGARLRLADPLPGRQAEGR